MNRVVELQQNVYHSVSHVKIGMNVHIVIKNTLLIRIQRCRISKLQKWWKKQ
ncbi:N-acetyltransferase 9-like protein [Bienertia sinuspersici]